MSKEELIYHCGKYVPKAALKPPPPPIGYKRTRKDIQQIPVPEPIRVFEHPDEDQTRRVRMVDVEKTEVFTVAQLETLLSECKPEQDVEDLITIAFALASKLGLACRVQMTKDAAGLETIQRIVIETQIGALQHVESY